MALVVEIKVGDVLIERIVAVRTNHYLGKRQGKVLRYMVVMENVSFQESFVLIIIYIPFVNIVKAGE